MKPDLIFANSPYGKPGVEITKYIMENFPNSNYAMLGKRLLLRNEQKLFLVRDLLCRRAKVITIKEARK